MENVRTIRLTSDTGDVLLMDEVEGCIVYARLKTGEGSDVLCKGRINVVDIVTLLASMASNDKELTEKAIALYLENRDEIMAMFEEKQ